MNMWHQYKCTAWCSILQKITWEDHNAYHITCPPVNKRLTQFATLNWKLISFKMKLKAYCGSQINSIHKWTRHFLLKERLVTLVEVSKINFYLHKLWLCYHNFTYNSSVSTTRLKTISTLSNLKKKPKMEPTLKVKYRNKKIIFINCDYFGCKIHL